MYRRRLFVLTVMLILLLQLSPAQQVSNQVPEKSKSFINSEYSSKNILFDESHNGNGSSLWIPGNASMFSWILRVHGYNSSTNFDESLDSGILNNYDILVLFFPFEDLTPGEVTAIHSFVSGGGSLLLVGVDGINKWGYDNSQLNLISEAYGITFGAELLSGKVDEFTTHNITAGVAELSLSGDDLFSCALDLTTPAESLIRKSGQTVVAAAETGNGRVVAVGTPGPFYMFRHKAYDIGENHFRFCVNVIDWLAGNPQRTATIPEVATITVGDGPDLTPSEVEEYEMFFGTYHSHTTHSDGEGTPEEVVDKGLSMGLDFMIITDHSWGTPLERAGITGGLAAQEFALTHNLDITVVVGAELSLIEHTTGWPLTENIWIGEVPDGVDGIHAQGGIATLAHPTISPNYARIYEALDTYGYDALEVDNEGYFFGGGEDGFFRPFLGSCDAHPLMAYELMFNVVFVENPTGPDGRVSQDDLKQAVLDRRVVIIDRWNDMVYGQKVWVDRFFEMWDIANTTVNSAWDTIDALKDDGENVGLSEAYLKLADRALDRWNPSKALKLAQNATSSLALGIDLQLTTPSIVIPEDDFQSSLSLTNNHSFPISANCNLYTYTPEVIQIVTHEGVLESPVNDSESILFDFNSHTRGIYYFILNVHSFNTSEYLLPIVIRDYGIINNVEHEQVEMDSGDGLKIDFWLGKDSVPYITSIALVYNDGSGEEEATMVLGWHEYTYTVGPYTTSTSVTFHIVITTTYGEIYTFPEQTVSIEVQPSFPFDMTMIIAVAVIGIGVVALVVVFIRRR